MVRAIRGATTVSVDTEEEVLLQTKILLSKIVEANNINLDDIISVFFSITKDIKSVFPAKGAREMGWTSVALMNYEEPEIQNSLKKCIRVLIHFNTDKTNNEIKYIYLNDAVILRPDLKM